MRDELPLASFNKGGEGRKLEESELFPRFRREITRIDYLMIRLLESRHQTPESPPSYWN